MVNKINMNIDKLSDRLNNLKIDANKWLDKNHPFDKNKILLEREMTLNSLKHAANIFGEKIENEDDLCRHVMGYMKDADYPLEEALLELGIYALAWDKIQNGTTI